VGSGRYAARLVEQMAGAVDLVELDAASVVRAIGRERVSGVEVRLGDERSRRIKVDALVFDGPGPPSFELAVQGGASVDFELDSGYFPRADASGLVAERLFVAGAELAATRRAIEPLLS
jgi:hypothetical protein